MRSVSIALVAIVACGGEAGAASSHVDDFSVDAMGWSGGTLPQWQANGGPLGDGDVRVPNSTHLATHNSTAAWAGDFTAIGAETISVDMRNEPGSQTLQMRLVLFGAGATPQSANRWTSTVAAVVPNDGVWRNYEFSLAESELTRVLGSSTYQAMITNVVTSDAPARRQPTVERRRLCECHAWDRQCPPSGCPPSPAITIVTGKSISTTTTRGVGCMAPPAPPPTAIKTE